MKRNLRLTLPLTVALLSAAAPAAAQLPDITSKKGITIGGHFSPWGGTIQLADSDSVLQSGGKCAFGVSYDMVNVGTGKTSPPFANRLRRGATVISQQTNLALHAGETKTIATQAYLWPGSQSVTLTLDDGNAVKESNERNNKFGVKVVVNSKCAGKTPTPGVIVPKPVTPVQFVTPQPITPPQRITPQAVTPVGRVSSRNVTRESRRGDDH